MAAPTYNNTGSVQQSFADIFGNPMFRKGDTAGAPPYSPMGMFTNKQFNMNGQLVGGTPMGMRNVSRNINGQPVDGNGGVMPFQAAPQLSPEQQMQQFNAQMQQQQNQTSAIQQMFMADKVPRRTDPAAQTADAQRAAMWGRAESARGWAPDQLAAKQQAYGFPGLRTPEQQSAFNAQYNPTGTSNNPAAQAGYYFSHSQPTTHPKPFDNNMWTPTIDYRKMTSMPIGPMHAGMF